MSLVLQRGDQLEVAVLVADQIMARLAAAHPAGSAPSRGWIAEVTRSEIQKAIKALAGTPIAGTKNRVFKVSLGTITAVHTLVLQELTERLPLPLRRYSPPPADTDLRDYDLSLISHKPNTLPTSRNAQPQRTLTHDRHTDAN